MVRFGSAPAVGRILARVVERERPAPNVHKAGASLAFWHGDGGGIQARKDLVGGDMQRMRRMANGSLGRVLSVGPDVATTYGSEQADKGI